jgi:hypothetical protein
MFYNVWYTERKCWVSRYTIEFYINLSYNNTVDINKDVNVQKLDSPRSTENRP